MPNLSSPRLLSELSPTNASSFFGVGQDISITPENGGLRLQCSGNDPQLLLPIFPFPTVGELELQIQIENRTAEVVMFHIYFLTRETSHYAEERTRAYALTTGQNSFSLSFDSAVLDGALRIDPSDKQGELFLSSFVLLAKDFDNSTPASSKPFILLFAGRTGSTYLTEALKCHPQIQMQGEILIAKRSADAQLAVADDAFRGIPGICGTMVAGFKTKLADIAEPHQFRRFLEARDCSIIYLTRKNVLKQIVSFVTSQRLHALSGTWNLISEQSRLKPFVLDLAEFDRWREYTERENGALENFLNGLELPLLRIDYEQFESDKTAVIAQVCRFLGVAPLPLQSSVLNNNPDDLRRVILNFDELADHLRESRYQEFLS